MEIKQIDGNVTHFFDSTSDFANAVEARCLCEGFRGRGSWNNPEHVTEAVHLARTGEPDKVPMAEKILADILNGIDLATLRPQWQPAMAGAFASVPDYLANDPENMRHRRVNHDMTAPMRVWCCTSVSAGNNLAEILTRGIAVLALAMALAETRPVEIFVFDVNPRMNVANKLSMNPIVLSELAYALTNGKMARFMQYPYIDSFDEIVGWPAGFMMEPREDYQVATNEKICRKLMFAGEQDLVIGPALYGDRTAFTNPIGWVRARLAEYIAEHLED